MCLFIFVSLLLFEKIINAQILKVVCVFPWLPTPWTNGAGAALWLGLTQDVLLPTALGLVDGRFNLWVSKAYRCGRGRKTEQDRPPKGLDGKFRPFTSTTQTLEAAPMVSQIRTRPIIPPPMNQMSQNDHKFPITNGSLYTSIDGRLPIIHNYRRHKVPGLRSPVHSISMGLHSTYVKRQESIMNQRPMDNFQNMEQCDDSFISLPADYTSHSTLEEKNPSIQHHHNHNCSQNLNKHVCMQNKPQSHANLKQHKKLSSSQNSLSDVSVIENELRKMRLSNLSKSQNNLNEINVTQRDIQKFRINPEMYQKQNLNLPKKTSEKDIESSDDEYFNHSINYTDDFKNYDTISSLSCCSITTEANGDFEFFAQQNDTKPTTTYQFSNDENTEHSPTSSNDSYIMKLNPNFNQKRNYPVMRSFKPIMCKTSTDSSSTASNSFSDNKTTRNNHNCLKNELNRNFRIRRSNSKQSLNNLDTYIKDTTNNNNKLERTNSNRSCDLFQYNKGTYVIRSNSNRSFDVMRSNPNISETTQMIQRKPSITHVNLRNLNSSCIHFNEKNEMYKNTGRDNIKNDKHRVSVPVLSMESLSSMLHQKGVSYLDNGDICNHNYGGSVPDFKKIFVTDFI